MTYSLYPAVLASSPTFAPDSASVTTTFTFTQGPELILDPANGQPTNLDQAVGVLNVTSQAPSGYAFDTNNPPATIKTWSVPSPGCWMAANAM